MSVTIEKLLEINNLSFGYDRVPIVRNVSLTISLGEILGVIGRNGVGKTTLVETIVGSLPCSVGEIFFSGTNITDKSPNFRALLGFGYVPQGRGIFAKLTVEENLRMGENISKERDNIEFNKLYEFFPILSDRRGQKAGTLSGGEQQMLAIGRALRGNPRLLVLDEPSEGIQPNIVYQIGELIRNLNSEIGLTVLLIEQNIRLILETVKRCLVIEKGEIVSTLKSEALKDSKTISSYLSI